MRHLWIDDLRPAPEGWVHVYSSDEAIYMLTYWRDKNIPLASVSFDHDLGGDDTSRRVLMWMIENEVFPQTAQIHSANPVGLDYLRGTMLRYFPNDVPISVVKYVGL